MIFGVHRLSSRFVVYLLRCCLTRGFQQLLSLRLLLLQLQKSFPPTNMVTERCVALSAYNCCSVQLAGFRACSHLLAVHGPTNLRATHSEKFMLCCIEFFCAGRVTNTVQSANKTH